MLASRIAVAPRGGTVGAWLGLAPWYYGWTIVAVAFLTVGVTQGTRAAFGLLLVPLADTFGWGRGLTAGALALNALVWAASAPLLGALLDRWGPRRVFAAAGTALGLGLAVAAATRDPWHLYLGVGVLAGIGLAPLMPNSQGVVIASWFVRQRGLAVSIVAAGIGLGWLVLLPLTQWAIGEAGWSAAFLVLAALFLLGVAPLNALVQRRRPEDCGLIADGEPTTKDQVGSSSAGGPSTVVDGPSVAAALGQPRFWALAVGFLLGVLPQMLLAAHAAAHLADVGFSPAVAAAVLGLSGAGMIGSMLLCGHLADRWGGEWAYTLGSLALLLGIALLYVVAPGRELLLPAYAALYALGSASRNGLHSFMAAALAQGRSFGALTGILGAHTAIGAALGPALGGWAFDQTGGYEPAFAVALASTAAAVACVWLAAPRRGRLPAAAQDAPSAAPSTDPTCGPDKLVGRHAGSAGAGR